MSIFNNEKNHSDMKYDREFFYNIFICEERIEFLFLYN